MSFEFAERNINYSSLLWEALVTYCLNAETGGKTSKGRWGDESGKNGELFGLLLEVAARSGAESTQAATSDYIDRI